MGFTHHWYQEHGAIPPEAWADITVDVRRLFRASPVALRGSLPSDPPQLDAFSITLNGVPGGQLFKLQRNPARRFAFCKTAFQPYDLVVTAILAVVASHVGEATPDPMIRVLSDGDAEHWREPLAWASRTLGRPIPDPIKRGD